MELIKKWHKALEKQDLSILDEVLADDVVLHSPVVWTPQKGKDIAKMYLMAAYYTIGGDDFKYVREIVSDRQACLEFTTKIGDIVINGVDIITINEEGKIIEFKVMVRPMKAMMILKDKMFELMQMMSGTTQDSK